MATKEEVATVNEAPKFGGLSVADVAQIIGGAKELPDTEVDAAMIAAQILGAGSLEEGLGESKAESLGNHLEEPFVIHDAKFQRSDEAYQGQGSPVYAVIDATFRSTGERVVLTSGGLNVLAGLGLIHKLDQWGETFKAKKVRTNSGFDALRLVYIPTGPTVDGPEAF